MTRREAEVLQLLAWDHSTEETAEALGISVYTVKNHLRVAGNKLGTNNTSRTSTVLAALRLGVISLQPPSPLGRFWLRDWEKLK